MPIFGGFARRPNVNGLSPWVYYTEVYVKWAKATARYSLAINGVCPVASAGCVAILAARAGQVAK